MNETDLDLLNRYTRQHAEDAFAELVRRHLNLVYSAALRQVRSPQLAEEVTQSTFTDLARDSHRLTPDTILTAWLYQVARRSAIDVVRRETSRQLREQIATEMNAVNASDANWSHIEPLLDQAMDALDTTDRAAVLLRYFENKSLREVGQTLGTSEDAAQKRVGRAVERLREYFTKHGISVGAGGLVVLITANAVEAAPVGLAAGISSAALAAAVPGVVPASALAPPALGLVKGTIHMMTSAKISVAIGVAAAAMIALQARQLSTQKQTVKQLEAQIAMDAQASHAQQAEIAKLQERMASYVTTIESMSRDTAKSRANARSAQDARQLAAAASKAAAQAKANPFGEMFNDPKMLEAMRPQQIATFKMMYGPLVKQLNLSPEQADKFYNIMVDTGIKSMEAIQSRKPFNERSGDADLQSLLGDAGFAQFKEYNKDEVNNQVMLATMKTYLVDNPLTDAQQQQLLQAIRTARQSVNAGTPPDFSKANPTDLDAMVAMGMDHALQQQVQINQSVLQQAAAFLSPDQLQTLGTSQSNSISMQKAMAPMTAKMFTPAAP